MHSTQIKAIRVIGAIVRQMNQIDATAQAVAVVDSHGMRVEYWEFDSDSQSWEKHSRGWFFNHGGWAANRRNAADIRRWCIG